jgi:protein-tyrosine phosphatase
VHCSGGSGRTGHILAAWLVHHRGLSVDDALDAVISTGRNPWEAVHCGNATEEQLRCLLAGTGSQHAG